MVDKKFIKAKYVNEEVILQWQHYEDGTPALQLFSETEGPVATATVNLSAYGIAPGEGCIIVKDYSEGEGMVDALLNAGVIVNRGTAYSFGFVENGAFECKVAPEYQEFVA